MNPLTAIRNSLDLAAAIAVSTVALVYITVTSGPVTAFRYGPGA